MSYIGMKSLTLVKDFTPWNKTPKDFTVPHTIDTEPKLTQRPHILEGSRPLSSAQTSHPAQTATTVKRAPPNTDPQVAY